MKDAADGGPLNVLGEPLADCSHDPLTGFFRDGCCRTGPQDRGLHVVCARLSDGFLQFSLARGNDLITPRPEFGFPGLADGDRWCLCAARWLEAFQAGPEHTPPVFLAATHQRALAIVPLDALKQHALDLS